MLGVTPRQTLWIVTCCVCVILAGCGRPAAEFRSNRIYMGLRANTGEPFQDQQIQDVVNAVTALFGTPDEPAFPTGADLNVTEVLDPDRLQSAKGPVTVENYGKGQALYRRHCVHCHGITGDGRGPTAEFLNPYPRDFRMGTFKFKSTPIGQKPTDDDLRRIVEHGIEGTAMPAFKVLLKEGEIQTLVDYVKYLAIRGEVERRLIDYQSTEADYETEIEATRNEFLSREFLVDTCLAEVLDTWREADSMATAVPERPAAYDRFNPDFDEAELARSIQRGRDLYYGAGQCFTCHGSSQLGDGQTTDYDKWTKEFYDWTKKDEDQPLRLKQYLDLGGLKPRNIIPRNLRQGAYRGGRRPVDIFWRIRNGIDGTPMPAANPTLVNDDAVWDMVNYVLALPYEPLSRPSEGIAYSRERQ
jgi:mono/diheme cytochrome c family protein